MWRITPIFIFMCGVLATHLATEDWTVLATSLAPDPPQLASAMLTADPEPPDPPTIEERVAAMTLEEKIGQLLMVGHWETEDYQTTRELVKAYNLGGIIIMEASETVIPNIPTWTESWQTASKIPLLVSIDQEGGVVSRLQTDEYIQTSQRELVSPTHATRIGETRGAELAALGINTNLAPVIDFASSSDAFLYERSFATSSEVGLMALALIEGHEAAGVLAIPKHFPGHDSTPDDSHHVLPVVDITAAEFPTHVTAFHELLDLSDVLALMTAHVQFPKLDAVYPATLSYEILTRQLRRELEFSGVIITDDMTMGAITNQWSSDEAALQALTAGADIVLFAAEPNAAIAARERILAAVITGELTEERIDESVIRILTLKQTQKLYQ